MDAVATAVALSLFPSLDYRSVSAGPYVYTQGRAPVLADGVPEFNSRGLELHTRRVWWTEDQLVDQSERGSFSESRLRLTQDASGAVHIDALELESRLLELRIRPEMGDQFSMGLFGGHYNQVLLAKDSGRAQLLVYSPQTLTLLGLSKSDMGTDAMRYYAEVGTGLGGDLIVRAAGPVSLHLRAEAEGTARRRRERTTVDYTVRGGGNELHHSTRQELTLEAEAGLGWKQDRRLWMVDVWGQHVTQWEPWDEGGADGMDRQYMAVGAKLTGRFYKESDPGPEFSDIELQEMLETIQRQRDEEDAAPPPPPPPAEPEPQPMLPQEVHWSELEFLDQPMPVWPAGTPDDFECEVQVFIDTTGVPFLVEPTVCPSPLVEVSVDAAEQWRVTPVADAEDTISARFRYTLTTAEVEIEALAPMEDTGAPATEQSE